MSAPPTPRAWKNLVLITACRPAIALTDWATSGTSSVDQDGMREGQREPNNHTEVHPGFTGPRARTGLGRLAVNRVGGPPAAPVDRDRR